MASVKPGYTPSHHTEDPKASSFNQTAKDVLPSKDGPRPVAELFHIYSDVGFTGMKSYTLQDDRKSPAFFVDCRGPHADMAVHVGHGTSGNIVGMINLHNWSSDEVVFPSPRGPIVCPFGKGGAFSRTFVVTLPAAERLPGKAQGEMFWKNTSDFGRSAWTKGNRKLVDSMDNCYAVFARNSSRGKAGRLNILVPGLDAELLAQIVTSAIAVIEKDRRQRSRAAAGAAGGGA